MNFGLTSARSCSYPSTILPSAPDDFGEQFQIPVIFQPDEEIQTVQVSVVDSTTAEGREHFFGHLQGEAGELVDVVNNATVNIINGIHYFDSTT